MWKQRDSSTKLNIYTTQQANRKGSTSPIAMGRALTQPLVCAAQRANRHGPTIPSAGHGVPDPSITLCSPNRPASMGHHLITLQLHQLASLALLSHREHNLILALCGQRGNIPTGSIVLGNLLSTRQVKSKVCQSLRYSRLDVSSLIIILLFRRFLQLSTLSLLFQPSIGESMSRLGCNW